MTQPPARPLRAGGRLLHALVCAALLTGVFAAGCGGAGGNASAGGSTGGSGLQGLILKPLKPAPPLALHNYTGQPVSLASLHGKAVLVTFVYTHCPDVCPLIVSDLAAAQRGLGKRGRGGQDPRRHGRPPA